jgi:putative transposase
MTAANPELDVQRLCRLAGLSRASYYRSITDDGGETHGHAVQEAIQAICLKHKYYGYRRVTALLRRQDMIVNHKKVLRLMREDNLLALRRAPFLVPPQVPPKGKPETFMIVPNLIRGIAPSAPDQVWVADITYVHLARAFVYLAVILDAFSRKAVGWALRHSLDASVAIAALDQALATRNPPKGSLIHHSDRGVQYASIAYRQRLADHDVILSMSRPGNPFDNAKAESFMKTLKHEEINARSFRTIEDASARIDDFIANIYNTERLHSALGYQSPLEFETAFAQTKPN